MMMMIIGIIFLINANCGIPFRLEDDSSGKNGETFQLTNRTKSFAKDRTTADNFDFNLRGNHSDPYFENLPHYYRQILDELTTIEFERPPDGEPYELKNPNETAEIFVFAYLGQFLSFIQPYDIPVEFLRDVLWNRLSIVSLIFQSLRVEAGFVACVTIGILLSLVVPTFAIASSCSTLCVMTKTSSSESASMTGERSAKSLIFLLLIVVTIIGSGVTAMLVTNEQLSSAMLTTPKMVSSALNDISTYIRNTQQQIHHLTLGTWSQVSLRVHHDLDEIEQQLGVPMRQQIAAETGVDVALDALFDIATVADNLSKKVVGLQEAHLKMRQMSREAADRLADLRHQVDSLRRACTAKDRPLCVTLDSAGLDIAIRTDALNIDPHLTVLRSMADKNLPQAVERVRRKFADIPAKIGFATRRIRDEIKRDLDVRKFRLERAMEPFEALVKDIRLRINGARQLAPSVEKTVNEIEQWRWLFFLTTGLLVLFLWLCFALALVYTCCDEDAKAKSILVTGLVFSSLLSILLWIIALAVMLVGGHGEVFVCRPLYDEPDFKSLSELIDDPGVIYRTGNAGFFRNLVSRNQTLDVPVKSVLEECKANRAAFAAFHLNTVINIDNHFERWEEIFEPFYRFNHNLTGLDFMDLELQNKLQSLLQATSVNMTNHRSQILRPIMGKDLASFAKQLDSVANQIKDLATSSRVESIASRTRRIIAANIEPLEKEKEEIIYQITALEVQITPLQRQVNQSISHLKTIQFYIDNQSEKIFQNKTEEYTAKLGRFLDQYRKQLTDGLENSIARCSPVFNVFNGIRHHVCQKTMDPLNGFWFALVWSLLGILIATPVALNLIHHYGQLRESLLHSRIGSVSSAERATIWSTPGNQANSDDNW